MDSLLFYQQRNFRCLVNLSEVPTQASNVKQMDFLEKIFLEGLDQQQEHKKTVKLNCLRKTLRYFLIFPSLSSGTRFCELFSAQVTDSAFKFQSINLMTYFTNDPRNLLSSDFPTFSLIAGIFQNNIRTASDENIFCTQSGDFVRRIQAEQETKEKKKSFHIQFAKICQLLKFVLKKN